MGIMDAFKKFKARNKLYNDTLEDARRGLGNDGEKWSRESYNILLTQYYEKYGANVFSEEVLSDLWDKTNVVPDLIKKDLKILIKTWTPSSHSKSEANLRPNLTTQPKPAVQPKQVTPKEYWSTIESYVTRYKYDVLSEKHICQIHQETLHDISKIEVDLKKAIELLKNKANNQTLQSKPATSPKPTTQPKPVTSSRKCQEQPLLQSDRDYLLLLNKYFEDIGMACYEQSNLKYLRDITNRPISEIRGDLKVIRARYNDLHGVPEPSQQSKTAIEKLAIQAELAAQSKTVIQRKPDAQQKRTTQSKSFSESENKINKLETIPDSLCLDLYCDYNSCEEKHYQSVIPSFITRFGEYLEHDRYIGYYGNDACIILQTVDDILIIYIQYEYHSINEDEPQKYSYKCYVDFTPGQQLHYACPCPFPDKNNLSERPVIRNQDLMLLFECISEHRLMEEMQSKGFNTDFRVDMDESRITLNNSHCTITQFISEALHMKEDLKVYAGSKEKIISDDIKKIAQEMRRREEKECSEIDPEALVNRIDIEALIDRFRN